MKYTDALRQNNPVVSLELIPPSRGASLDALYSCIDKVAVFNPQFITVTKHQQAIRVEEINGELVKIPGNKKPGTVAVSTALKQRFGIETVPHIICAGVDKFRIEDMLIELRYLGFDNVFALRGDPRPGERFEAAKDGYRYAVELIEQIQAMNNGRYVTPGEPAERTDFCIGAAGYPEKHVEALNIERDAQYCAEKVQAGASYIITQMFFDADIYLQFVARVRALGVTVPIIPGIKPITDRKTLDLLPRAFQVSVPERLIAALDAARSPAEEWEAGTEYMASLVERLLQEGVPGVHVFTYGQGRSTRSLLQAVFGHAAV